jgi:hypothetical protein
MYKKLILITFIASTIITARAATISDTSRVTPDSPLIFSGSVDIYYKADFSGHPNILTSFANENNSVSIGMIDLAFKKKVGKASGQKN